MGAWCRYARCQLGLLNIELSEPWWYLLKVFFLRHIYQGLKLQRVFPAINLLTVAFNFLLQKTFQIFQDSGAKPQMVSL